MPIPSPIDSVSVPAVQDSVQPNEQRAETSNLFLRNDTIFGVCEGIGQDFGFNANFLRVPLAVMVLASPLMAIGIYLGLGAAVLASRLIAPAPRQAAAPQAADSSAQRSAENTAEEELLAA